MTPPSPCGCRVSWYRETSPETFLNDPHVVYCPLHAAAEEMLAALKDAAWLLGSNRLEYPRTVARFEEIIEKIERGEGRGASPSLSSQRSEGKREP